MALFAVLAVPFLIAWAAGCGKNEVIVPACNADCVCADDDGVGGGGGGDDDDSAPTGNRSPVIHHLPDLYVNVFNSVLFEVQAHDGDGDPLTFSAENLPDGSGFDPATALFNWTPVRTGLGVHSNLLFRATDPYGAFDEELVNITVLDTVVSEKIVFCNLRNAMTTNIPLVPVCLQTNLAEGEGVGEFFLSVNHVPYSIEPAVCETDKYFGDVRLVAFPEPNLIVGTLRLTSGEFHQNYLTVFFAPLARIVTDALAYINAGGSLVAADLSAGVVLGRIPLGDEPLKSIFFDQREQLVYAVSQDHLYRVSAEYNELAVDWPEALSSSGLASMSGGHVLYLLNSELTGVLGYDLSASAITASFTILDEAESVPARAELNLSDFGLHVYYGPVKTFDASGRELSRIEGLGEPGLAAEIRAFDGPAKLICGGGTTAEGGWLYQIDQANGALEASYKTTEDNPGLNFNTSVLPPGKGNVFFAGNLYDLAAYDVIAFTNLWTTAAADGLPKNLALDPTEDLLFFNSQGCERVTFVDPETGEFGPVTFPAMDLGRFIIKQGAE